MSGDVLLRAVQQEHAAHVGVPVQGRRRERRVALGVLRAVVAVRGQEGGDAGQPAVCGGVVERRVAQLSRGASADRDARLT